MNIESMKQLDDLESTKDLRIVSVRVSEVRERVSESGFKRAVALRVTEFAHGSSTQSLGHVGFQGLLNLFLGPNQVKMWTGPDHAWPWMWPSFSLDNP